MWRWESLSPFIENKFAFCVCVIYFEWINKSMLNLGLEHLPFFEMTGIFVVLV